jgi:uncharacterized protein (TIGR01777 family)
MRVVITGGTGLVGRALARSLAHDGHDLVVLTRDPAAAARVLPAGTQALRWGGGPPGEWSSAVDGADAVVNLAGANLGEARWTAARKELIRHSRLGSVEAVAEAVSLAARPPAVVVQASAVGYYGYRGDEILDEGAEAGQDYMAQAVLVAAERLANRMEAHDVRVAMARSGVVLAADGGALPRMLLPFRLFVGGRIGSGRQYLSWIHLADEVRALRFLMESPDAAGAFNLTAPSPVTNATFAATVGRVMHRPAVFPVPAAALRLVFGEMSGVLLRGQRVVPRRLRELGFAFRFPEIEPALADLLG